MQIKITKDTITPVLRALSQIDYTKIKRDTATQIYNRGKMREWTPFRTGELRISLTSENDEAGYRKDYAPHVEYGHRTRNGGFVPGQRFLQKNAEAQAPLYKKDVEEVIKKTAESGGH